MVPYDEDDFDDTWVGDLPDLPAGEAVPEEVKDGDVVSIEEAFPEEITAPHDGREWLAGFRAGHRGLRSDYHRAITLWARAFGFTDEKTEKILHEVKIIAEGDSRNKIRGGSK